jgi:hypothetical protein
VHRWVIRNLHTTRTQWVIGCAYAHRALNRSPTAGGRRKDTGRYLHVANYDAVTVFNNSPYDGLDHFAVMLSVSYDLCCSVYKVSSATQTAIRTKEEKLVSEHAKGCTDGLAHQLSSALKVYFVVTTRIMFVYIMLKHSLLGVL